MGFVTLGKTGIKAQKQAFGCLPIQRISKEDAVSLLHRAYDGGMNYFDTARAYSDSEEKVGAAFADMRDKVVHRHQNRRHHCRRHVEGSGGEPAHAPD